jgi:ferredoxin
MLDGLAQALAPFGLILRGGFRPAAGDGAPSGVGTLLLIGNAGPALWRTFDRDRAEGADPLNRWTERLVRPLAARFGARALFPFEGPPYWPFQRWARAAEPVRASPLGLLIHPVYGLWHAYRAALAFAATDIPLPPRGDAPDLCADCVSKPCLTACPVNAFSGQEHDVPACVDHLRPVAGGECLESGCRARRACPVGQEYAYEPAQAHFHMSAFECNQP